MTARSSRTSVLLLATWLLGAQPALAGQAQDNQRFDALIGIARVKRDAGDLPAARRYFDEARRVRALSPSELAEYFWVLAGQDSTAALAVGRSVLAATPANSDIRDRMITEAIALSDEDSVTRLAAEGHRLEPGTARWPGRLAESLLRLDRPADAAVQFAVATAAPDATDRDRVGLAVALEAARQFVESAEAWKSVPAAVRAERLEWEHSRLRALAHGAAPADASAELETWLAAHAGDDAMRGELVDLWARAADPARALAAMPAIDVATDVQLRQRAALARSAGDQAAAVAALEALTARASATRTDRVALAAALLDDTRFDLAAASLRSLISSSNACDARVLAQIDRLADPAATDLMIAAVDRWQCGGEPHWIRRAAERAVALSRHAEALAMLACLPSPDADRADVRRLEGQLRLWTGDAAGAVAALSGVLESNPQDVDARSSLADALRSLHRPLEAWRIAEPLAAAATVSADRLIALAQLALEADEPSRVAGLLERVPAVPAYRVARLTLLGRAFLATGWPAEAIRVLNGLPDGDLDPAGALALIDGTRAMSGPAAALDVARRFPNENTNWQDVLERRAVLEATEGDARVSEALVGTLERLNPETALVARIETALALEHPEEALEILATADSTVRPARVADLEAIALAGAGRLHEALAVTRRLRQDDPYSTTLIFREAELAFRLSPDSTTLARLIEAAVPLSSSQRTSFVIARAYATLRFDERALDALGPAATWPNLPLEGRLIAARSLHALHRSADAVAVLTDVPASDAAAAAFHAELVAIVEGPARAASAYAELASRPNATSNIFLKWAEATPAAGERVAIFESAAGRFPKDANILVQLAAARLAKGDVTGAREAAWRALDLDPRAVDAWFTLIDAGESNADIDIVLERFESLATAQPALVISMADRLAGLVRSHADPLVDRAVRWLERIPADDETLAMSRDMALARILAAAERWTESIAAVDRALLRDQDSPTALKLRAELLSWSGRHAEAVAAYTTYLTKQPGDVAARRQQARVAGWGGAYGDARLLYAALTKAYPADAAIAAEAAAKSAYYEGRWRAAVAAYDDWVALEPEDGEALFERAEALRAAGHEADADAALTALASTTGHRLGTAELDRVQTLRGRSISAIGSARSADGYAGQRLLDLQEQGGRYGVSLGQASPATFSGDVSHVRASAMNAVRHGLRVGAETRITARPNLQVSGRLSLWDFSDSGPVMADFTVRTAWRPLDRWTFGAGAGREPLFENMTTIEHRLAATGVFGDAAFESPRWSMTAQAVRQRLSDGNARTRATASASGVVSDRFKQLRVVAWAEALSYRTGAADYFAPANHLRLDAGLEYTHEFRTPRFRIDRQQTLSFGYLFGVDNRGNTYQHPSLRLAVEFARGVAIDARAGWIRSAVYNETSAFIGLTLHPNADRQR